MDMTQKEIQNLICSRVPLWRRAFAYIIDFLIIGLIILIPLQGFYSDIPEEGGLSEAMTYLSDREMTPQMFVIQFLIAFLSILYWAILEYKLGQSIGKLLMGIKIERAVSFKNKRISFWECFLRNVSKFNLILVILDSLYMLFKRGEQRYLEVVTNTRVVYADNGVCVNKKLKRGRKRVY